MHMGSSNEEIMDVLDELGKQQALERSGKVDVRPEDRMLAITRDTGELLNMILRIKGAKNVLEIGTSVGYSAIWCAEAIVGNSGNIITIEQNPDKIRRAKQNFQRARVSDVITIKQGTAMHILKEMSQQQKYGGYFDMVLIDADKESVTEYFELALRMVSVGGVIVTDNMLYPEKHKQHMKKFADGLRTNPNLRSITSAIGNGEEITIRLK